MVYDRFRFSTQRFFSLPHAEIPAPAILLFFFHALKKQNNQVKNGDVFYGAALRHGEIVVTPAYGKAVGKSQRCGKDVRKPVVNSK